MQCDGKSLIRLQLTIGSLRRYEFPHLLEMSEEIDSSSGVRQIIVGHEVNFVVFEKFIGEEPVCWQTRR